MSPGALQPQPLALCLPRAAARAPGAAGRSIQDTGPESLSGWNYLCVTSVHSPLSEAGPRKGHEILEMTGLGKATDT